MRETSNLPTRPANPRDLGEARKRVLFRAITILLLLFCGVMAAEALLRWQKAGVQRKNTLEPGMVEYDSVLGWKMVPGWKGSHQHTDFHARYSVDARGFRTGTPERGRRPLTIVLGDSFTFGLGVGDAETFVHLLNATPGQGPIYLNAGVPGYSTDQQALLLDKRLLELAPERLLLMVYVGNDLFDNLRSIPLQVGGPKPYYELQNDRLVLRNQPVPRSATSRPPTGDLTSVVLGEDRAQWPWKTRLEQRSELFRMLAEPLLADPNLDEAFARRFASALRVFELLLEKVQAQCELRKIELRVGVLAGKSFVERPASISGQYQDYFCRQISTMLRSRNIVHIDIASAMRSRYERTPERWFFPNDGHLTPAGHQLVAALLREHLEPAK